MVQLVDGRSLPDSQTAAICDICIVGAGAAGIYLATRLASKGLTIILLEAGDKTCTDAATAGIEAVVPGGFYKGATEGRASGLGGTTSRWGGLLFPHTSHDYRTHPMDAFDPWRHIVGVVEQWSAIVADVLGINVESDSYAVAASYFNGLADSLQKEGMDAGIAEFLPFRKRNFSFLFNNKKYHGGVTVYLNTVASAWESELAITSGSKLVAVKAQASDRHIKIVANKFVIAAGAIESARLLLEIQRQSVVSPFPSGAAIGRYLSDHLSCSIAKVEQDDWVKARALFGPRFYKGQMRSFRFVESSAPQGIPRYFAHFIFENENAGFQLARKLIASIQSRTSPEVSMAEVGNGINGFLLLAWYRWIKSRLYIAESTPVHLQLDIEQEADVRNRIQLGDKFDSTGRPEAILDWELRPKDYSNISEVVTRVLKSWASVREDVPRLIPLIEDGVNHKPHDVYHPVGTCRLGTDTEAVVDPNLKVNGMSNLYVLSTAVFPTAGTANPTFSMLCLGEDLANRLGTNPGS